MIRESNEPRRHSNSFTYEAVDAFQALARKALCIPELHAVMQSPGMNELLSKMQNAHRKQELRRLREQLPESQAAE